MAITTIPSKNDIYTDFRADFLTHPVKKDLLILTKEDAVKRSIKNLLLTAQYERFGQPNLGSGLAALLFENIGIITEKLIRDSIITTIKNYERRANIIEVVVQADPDNNRYLATITFSVINRIDPVTFTHILQRIR